MEVNMGVAATEFNYRVALGSSRLAALFIVSMGASTLAILSLMPLDALLKAFVVLWVGATMLGAYRNVSLHAGRRGVRGIVIRGEEIDVVDSSGAWLRGVLRPGSFVSAGLTIIRWRPPRARLDRSIVVLPDMLPPDAFRRLRVVLRWK
jgi:hypothetical protein